MDFVPGRRPHRLRDAPESWCPSLEHKSFAVLASPRTGRIIGFSDIPSCPLIQRRAAVGAGLGAHIVALLAGAADTSGAAVSRILQAPLGHEPSLLVGSAAASALAKLGAASRGPFNSPGMPRAANTAPPVRRQVLETRKRENAGSNELLTQVWRKSTPTNREAVWLWFSRLIRMAPPCELSNSSAIQQD